MEEAPKRKRGRPKKEKVDPIPQAPKDKDMRTVKLSRYRVPLEKKAQELSDFDFVTVSQVAFFLRVDEKFVRDLFKSAHLQSYTLLDSSNRPAQGFRNTKVKATLAARGYLFPGYNIDLASSRQWLELLQGAVDKPLDTNWYFPPVNPDPLLRITKEKASGILTKIRHLMASNDVISPENLVRSIADTINEDSRDYPLKPKLFS